MMSPTPTPLPRWPSFEAFLLAPHGGGQLRVRLFPEAGIWTGVTRKLFHGAIQVGLIDDFLDIADNWCYPDLKTAQTQLLAWDPTLGGEPTGWHRHPATGRRRPDCDPAREYIAF